MAAVSELFDAKLMTARRDRAAASASHHDFLLERVAQDFAERLAIIKRRFPAAINLGAYHGVVSRALRPSPQIGIMIDVEPSPALLALCDGPRVQGAADAVPFADASLDLVVSALALQLVDDLPGALAQIRRALKPDGLLLCALLGGETLKELREAWIVAEEEVMGGVSPRVVPFADVRQLGGLLQRAGFALPVVDSDVVQVSYASPLALMQELKAMGASNMLRARGRVPVTRRLLMRAAEVYAERFGLANGRVTATFEIVTMTGWVPHESQQKPLRPGSAEKRLADVLGVYDGVDGIKTGFDDLAGLCLVATATRDGNRAIAVVMNSDRYGPDADARVVAALGDDLGLVAEAVDGAAGRQDGGRRLDGEAADDLLAGRDAP